LAGISGLVDFNGNIDKFLVKKINDSISHRGPDGEGFYTDRFVGLGYRKLNLLNENENQPVQNENHTIHVVCDGHCYNYDQLKLELEKLGHKFNTDLDVEVLVHLYEEYSFDFLKKFRGVFALALWDSEKKLLILARDKMGVRPLFYAKVNGKLIFGSEQKCILACRDYDVQVNPDSVRNFLSTRYNYSNETLFKGINKIPIANMLIATRNSTHLKRYWNYVIKETTEKSEQELASELKNLLLDAVKVSLVDGAKIGSYLSGGVDSGGVVGLISQFRNDLHTFSVGFGGYGFDELERAKQTAEHFGTNHHELIIKPNIIKDFPKVIWHMDEPMADLANIPNFEMAKEAKKYGINLVFTGETNDEVWIGYEQAPQYQRFVEISNKIPKFIKTNFPKWISKLPNSFVKTKLEHLDRFYAPKKCFSRQTVFSDEYSLFNESFKSKFTHEKKPGEEMADKIFNPNYSMITNFEKNWLEYLVPHGYLVKADRTTTANGVEIRFPLIDPNIVEFSFTVPPELKYTKQGVEKYLYRQAMKEILPEFLYKRKKRGFNVPTIKWLPELKEMAGALIDNDIFYRRGYFKQEYIQKLLTKVNNPSKVEDQQLWDLIALEIWHRIYIDKLPLNKIV